jgi:nucleotide-binding universal stress UspA family protein
MRAFAARATLLYVLELEGGGEQVRRVDPLDWRIRRAEAEAYLANVAERLQAADFQAERVVLEGQPAERVVEYARNHDVDLIVLSSHGKSGLSRWNVSSVVEKIIQGAHLSFLIVRAYQPVAGDLAGLQYKRLLLPLDGSQRAECVLAPATTLARVHRAQLLAAHAVLRPALLQRVPPTPEDVELVERLTERNRQAAAKYLEQLAPRLSVDVEARLLVTDQVAASLHDLVETENVDLVVLSAHGAAAQTKWSHGSVTTSFIDYGSTPLLVVQDLPPEEVELTKAEVAAAEYKGH